MKREDDTPPLSLFRRSCVEKVTQEGSCTPLYTFPTLVCGKSDQSDARVWKFWTYSAQKAKKDARPPLCVGFFRVICGESGHGPVERCPCFASLRRDRN